MKVHKLKNRLNQATQRVQELEKLMQVLDFQLKEQSRKMFLLEKELYQYKHQEAQKKGQNLIFS